VTQKQEVKNAELRIGDTTAAGMGRKKALRAAGPSDFSPCVVAAQ
jgi:hypothetical protein